MEIPFYSHFFHRIRVSQEIGEEIVSVAKMTSIIKSVSHINTILYSIVFIVLILEQLSQTGQVYIGIYNFEKWGGNGKTN